MENILCQYCDRSCFKKYSEEIFMKWLVDVLGPVISGVKPAEVLSFKHCDPFSEEKMATIRKYLSTLPILKFSEKEISDGSIKVLFYHKNALQTQIDKRVVRQFLSTSGYGATWSLQRCIFELLSRFENSEMPHEIGVFLGYPLKDVLGFLGNVKLAYQKTQGWRVYGDPTLSDKVFEQFFQARSEIRRRLLDESPLDILHCA